MYSTKATSVKEIRYVLDNLNPEAVSELKVLFGDSYKKNAFQIIRATTVKSIIKLKDTNEPVGVYGLVPLKVGSQSGLTPHPNPHIKKREKRIAGTLFLTTSNLHKGNIIKLLRTAKKQIEIWQNQYSTILDSCHKSSKTIQKWLTLLGFKPSGWEDNDIHVYYKGKWDDEIEKELKNNV